MTETKETDKKERREKKHKKEKRDEAGQVIDHPDKVDVARGAAASPVTRLSPTTTIDNTTVGSPLPLVIQRAASRLVTREEEEIPPSARYLGAVTYHGGPRDENELKCLTNRLVSSRLSWEGNRSPDFVCTGSHTKLGTRSGAGEVPKPNQTNAYIHTVPYLLHPDQYR
ncbi:hypothetical protein LZ554_005444 [Drepanopeziza brunnea f. sp. 'monogermtubi']|nr:hypothetical protein LZ554_005444 [Drepanopeziza brunnea f. sp. 'monogermtubi']